MSVSIEDKVSFSPRGTNRLEGVVKRIRIKKSRRLEQLEARLNIPSHSSLSRVLVAEVATAEGIWTVPVSTLTVTGRAGAQEAEAADKQYHAVKSSITTRIVERRNSNFEGAQANGLLNLVPNQRIEVQFRNTGWQPVFFVRYNTSGAIVFRDRFNRERKTHPKFCRLPISKEAVS
jgi:hypothetical protein